MGNTNHRYDYEEDDRRFKAKKHPKHTPNVKGKGMKTLNSYVEEIDDEDYILEEDDQDNTRFHTTY